MVASLSHFRRLGALIALPMAIGSAALAQGDAPRRIVNIAEARWEQGGEEIARPSNPVTTAVLAAGTGSARIVPMHLSRVAGAVAMPVARPLCTGSAGSIPTPLDAQGIAAGTQPSLAPATGIRGGEPLYFALTLPGANASATTSDSVRTTIRSSEGDREVLTITETGADTGVFTGVIQTRLSPPAPVHGDCYLTVARDDTITVESMMTQNGFPALSTQVTVLVDPYGLVFDSEDGTPIDGVTVTLVDDDTGQPAAVRGVDGVSAYPSTVVTGRDVTDAGGMVYPGVPGDYRFPLVAQGRYRLVVVPPAPYVAPSRATPAELAALRRSDGQPMTIAAGSFGGAIPVDTLDAVRVDVPLDRPRLPATLGKVADVAVAEPGDPVIYTVTVRNPDARARRGLVLVDTLPAAMRLRPDTVRIDGTARPAAVAPSADGGTLAVDLGTLAAGAERVVRYALEVRLDATDGVAVNRARLRDASGSDGTAVDAAVRIVRETIADRMTLIGRVTDGGCTTDPARQHGVPGVRVLLEDGSYAITDLDGRYHLQGILPGLHTVGIEPSKLPPGARAVDCARNTRTADSAISRFVDGNGGSLHRADFHIEAGATVPPLATAAALPEVQTDRQAAGGERDWFAGQTPGIDWIYPEPDTNPRARAVRIVIKHAPGQKVTLLADGKPVDPVTFEGERENSDKTIAIGLWRGVPLGETGTRFTAEVRGADGTLIETLERHVAFVGAAFDASIVRVQSVLIADGVTRPVIALRITDRNGRPVHHGLTGELRLPAPYLAAMAAEAMQSRQLAGLERARPVWRVEGDAGIARIVLEPTTVSGALALLLPFAEGKTVRERRIDLWLDPGDRPWTLVGLAEGTIGHGRIGKGIEPLGTAADDIAADGRIALTARGRVSGKWLMSLAYDSAKREDATRFGGTIDPQQYYTVYADQSERRQSAASIRKLYLKLERPQFQALFGDYDTAIDEPALARYVRSFNGVKAEFRSDTASASVFAADAPTRHRRDELQGNGLSGPYALTARDLLPNSETVAIEVRDRLRGDRVVDRRVLVRNVDYDIDTAAGRLRFREPVLSRTSDLDPQIITVDYEVNGVGARTLNAGGRAAVTRGKLRLGATLIRDADGDGATTLTGIDARLRPTASSEIRAEVSASRGEGARAAGMASAWLVEAEQHGRTHDVLLYARQEGTGFGVGQTARTTQGRRTIGAEGSFKPGDTLQVTAAAWREQALDTPAARIAARGQAEFRTSLADLRAGLTFAQDDRGNGDTARSSIVQFGATRRLFDNALELDAQTDFALGGADDSVDFPARTKFGARLQVARDVKLVGSYEHARGDAVDADTVRFGFDVAPWAGGRLTSEVGRQSAMEYGARSFAAYGLAQSLQLGKHWSVDASVDGNRTLSGIDQAAIVNPAHPVASGGFLASDGSATEDFIAVTGGGTYRGELWSGTGRAEYRTGSLGDRRALTASLLRRIGDGQALGALLTVAQAEDKTGQATSAAALALSWAYRPAESRWSWLDKLEARSDSVRGATIGRAGPIGGVPLGVSGDFASRRMVNSLSVNYTADERSEVSLFWGTRYVSTRFGDADVSGWSNIVSLDGRIDLTDRIDLGLVASARLSTGFRTLLYSVGPSLGFSPTGGSWIVIGYNISGYDDRDFAAARQTRAGPYAALRLKLDNSLLAELGLQ